MGWGKAYAAGVHDVTIALQVLVAASIFFVWGVRYSNIVEEFKHYRLPDELRDFVGILKITFALMLLVGIEHVRFALIGGLGIALLMGAALATHVRMHNPLAKMLPALSLLILAIVIAWINYRLLAV